MIATCEENKFILIFSNGGGGGGVDQQNWTHLNTYLETKPSKNQKLLLFGKVVQND